MDDELKEYVENLLKDGTLFGRLVKLVTAPPPGGPFLVAPAPQPPAAGAFLVNAPLPSIERPLGPQTSS